MNAPLGSALVEGHRVANADPPATTDTPDTSAVRELRFDDGIPGDRKSVV